MVPDDYFHVGTARQLWGITILVRAFRHKACGNLCECQYMAPSNVLKTYREHLTKFSQVFDRHFCPLLVSIFFSRESWFSHCPKGSVVRLCWLHSAVSCGCMQNTILNQSSNHANQYPIYNNWKYCLVLKLISHAGVPCDSSISD